MTKRDSQLKALYRGMDVEGYVAKRKAQEILRRQSDEQWMKEQGLVPGRQPGATLPLVGGPEVYKMGAADPTVLGPPADQPSGTEWRSMPWYQRMKEMFVGTPASQAKQGQFFGNLPEYYTQQVQGMMPMGDIPIRDKRGRVVEWRPREEYERRRTKLDPTEQAAADPLLAVLDLLVPGPEGAQLGKLTHPSFKLPGGKQVLHPADLRKALKWGESPSYLREKGNNLMDLAIDMGKGGLSAQADETMKLSLMMEDIADGLEKTATARRPAVFGITEGAQKARDQMFGHLSPERRLVVEEALSRSSESIFQPKGALQQGVSREMLERKGVERFTPGEGPVRAARQSMKGALQQVQGAPPGHPTREALLKGVAHPEHETYVDINPIEAYIEAGYSPAEAVEAGGGTSFRTMGARIPSRKSTTMSSIWTSEPENVSIMLHEGMHARKKEGSIAEFFDRYAKEVAGRDMPKTKSFGVPERLSPNIQRYARDPRVEGSYTGISDVGILEESFVYDIEQYLSGQLGYRARAAVQRGDLDSRDVNTLLWLNENMPHKGRGPSGAAAAKNQADLVKKIKLLRQSEEQFKGEPGFLKELAGEETMGRKMARRPK